jgi:hypothetical protein
MPASGSAATGSPAAPAVPRYDHVFMVVEENHSFGQIIGNPMAPNLNRLASAYGLATQYFGITNPSAPNYVAMLGGSSFGVHTDDAYWTDNVNAPSLMSQLEATGSSWKGYHQNMPYAGYRGYCYPVRSLGVPDSDTLYIAKHNGIPYFDSINQHPSELAKMLPLPRLQQDLSTGQVANFNYVIPDECTDMHGAPPVCVDSGNPGDVNDNWLVSTADQFVGNLVQGITSSSMWSKGNNAVVVTCDEGVDNGGCCGTVPGSGQVPAIVVTSHGPRQATDSTAYNHYSPLSTLQHTFGVGCLQANGHHGLQRGVAGRSQPQPEQQGQQPGVSVGRPLPRTCGPWATSTPTPTRTCSATSASTGTAAAGQPWPCPTPGWVRTPCSGCLRCRRARRGQPAISPTTHFVSAR